MNCADGFDHLLMEFSKLSKEGQVKSSLPLVSHTNTNSKPFTVEGADYQNLHIDEQNAFKYVCGYLINKYLKVHFCKVCNN